jgi:O-antigen/teichoic acid export membrane protein
VRNILQTESKSLQEKVLSGSFVLLTGSGFATVINFLYNLVVARFLGPTVFGHATAVYTLLILISAVTLSFQIVSAKVVAQQDSPEEKGAMYRSFHQRAWACGVFVGLVLVLFRTAISTYLNLPNPMLVVLLGVGVVFYVPLGTRRGYIQGALKFHSLAINLVIEGAVRLGGSALVILLGYGLTGVIVANSAAIVMAYLFAMPRLPVVGPAKVSVGVAFREGLQAIVFFVGQVVINNCDILLVKHFFPPALAGLYAAVALVGRVVYALSWSVVSTMFPIVAGTRKSERKGYGVLGTSLLLVLAIGGTLTLGLRLAPAQIWTTLFGAQFGMATQHSLPFLLAMYAATTTVYALSVVMIAYEMSHRIANTGWVQLAFSVVLIAGISFFHSSLEEVIGVQLIMMVLLLLIVAAPFLVQSITGFDDWQPTSGSREMRKIRALSENEVIAEFLKSDFHSPEFEDHQKLGRLVTSPNLDDDRENLLRRALLFLRHGALWRELPKSTDWFEVEVRLDDQERIRMFPRAQWRKLARGNFAMTEVAKSITGGASRDLREKTFVTKIESLSDQLRQDVPVGTVLLIAINENGPFTILDGNHRTMAALLVSPETVQKLRFFCGFSPRMAECCWYQTNISTLLRYGKNLLKHSVRDPEAELESLVGSI